VFSSPGIGEEVCNDGIDNDGDRLVDEDCPPSPRDCRKEIKEAEDKLEEAKGILAMASKTLADAREHLKNIERMSDIRTYTGDLEIARNAVSEAEAEESAAAFEVSKAELALSEIKIDCKEGF
jgi:hypothetical protein